MPYSTIQSGKGSNRPLVVLFLAPAEALPRAFKGATVLTYSGTFSSATWEPLRKEAHRSGWVDGPIVLIGYSAGCAAVRELCRESLDGVLAVVAIDGTSGPKGSVPPDDRFVSPWRDVADRARRGDLLFVATHTYQTYTEALPPPERYPATVSVLRLATGLPLVEPCDVEPAIVRAGGMTVLSYASGSIDAGAHRAQASSVLPHVLKRYVAPALGGSDDAIEGIDVSAHNPIASIPWRTVGFGFVRVSHGLGYDQSALEHLSRAKAAGVEDLGVYHYLRGDRGGREQAESFWRRVKQLEEAFGPLALALDVEDLPKPHPPWDLESYRTIAIDFLTRLSTLSERPCALYGSPGYLATMRMPKEVVGPLWVAHWGVSSPTVPAPWEEWTVHQYAIIGGLDRNHFRAGAGGWRSIFGLEPEPEPFPYDTLGGVVLAITKAAGGTPELYSNHEEGPVVS